MVQIDLYLDEETTAHYEERTEAAGRTLGEQLAYEVMVNHGLTAPDPGDTEATQRGQLFQRIFQGRVLEG